MPRTPVLSRDDLRALRAGAQLLHRPEPRLPAAEVVHRLVGVQAQALAPAALALRARTAGPTAVDVDVARVQERSIVRTWAMRGTLHLVAAEDVHWLRALLAPSCLPGAHRRLRQLGVERGGAEKAVSLIREFLTTEGPLTRAEIADRLAPHGIATGGQAAFHLLRLAVLEGVACMGPDRDSEPAFVPLPDWVGPQRSREPQAALRELVRRYLAAYGPARPEDFAAWSGLRLTLAREAWGDLAELVEVQVEVEGSRMWLLRSQAGERAPRGLVRLVPSFDTSLLGYRGRDLALPAAHAHRVFPGGGWLHPAVLLDGRAIATWRTDRRASGLRLTVEPFSRLDPALAPALDAEAADVARFLATPTELVVAGQAG